MLIQFNTDHNISGSEERREPLIGMIEHGLKHYEQHITRVEVHLNDENSHKDGNNDKRCMLEVRLEHKQPIAVTSHANTHEEAVDHAVDKMKASLSTVLGKLKEH